MTKKHIGIFLGVTVIVLVAAIVAVNKEQNAVVNKQAGAYLFPGLEAKINDVDKIEVVKSEDHVTIQHKDNKWQIAEKDDYPADLSKIKEVVMKIAAFTTVEPKTKKPENFGKLNVEDPKDENAKSVQVTLTDKAGKEMASVVVGRMESGGFSTVGQDKTYVRKAKDNQVWLVNGGLTVNEAPSNWVTEEILNINSSRVKKVAITHKGGKAVIVEKEKPGNGDFVLADLPKGKQAKSQSELTQVARSMERLRMLDVQKADGFAFPEDKTITTELQTFDGLVISASTLKQNGNYLSKFSARFDPALRPAEPPAVKASEANKKDEAKNSDGKKDTPAADPHASKPPALKEAALVKQEADQLNQQLSPWVFTLNKSKAKNLVEEMDDLVKDKS
jgi:hypothetical protein